MAQLALNVKKKLPREGGAASLAGGGGSGSGGGPGKATSMNGLPTTGTDACKLRPPYSYTQFNLYGTGNGGVGMIFLGDDISILRQISM